VVALLDPLVVRWRLRDDPRALVPARERVDADRHVAGGDVVVGVAKAGRHQLHLDLARARVVDLEVDHLVLAGCLAKDCSAGLHAGSPLNGVRTSAVHSSARRPWEDLRSVDATP
jgi:hypothetical protein